jgi:SSS family solute:Na+ symporter
VLGLGRLLTVGVGVAATAVALFLPRVLDLVLLAYSFMVSGLFVPTVAGLFWRRATPTAAFWSMLCGGCVSVALNLYPLPELLGGLDPIFVALPASAVVLVALSAAGGGDVR